MTNKDEHIFQLLLEKLSGEISDENRLYLEQVMQEDASVKRCLEEMEEALAAAGPEFMTDVYNEIAWSRVLSLMTSEQAKSEEPTLSSPEIPAPAAQVIPMSATPVKKSRRAYKWGIAAAITGIISTSLYFLLTGSFSRQSGNMIADNIDLPSQADVQLLLENGDTIQLAGKDGAEIITQPARLRTRSGHLSFTTNNGASGWNTLAVPTGKDYSIALADGSTIHLNAFSRLRFPFSFSGKTREVYLEGEAFFDIAPNAEQPFIVHTGETSIRVLSTAFNVNAYSDSLVVTSLVKGSVVTKVNDQQSIVLHPGNETIYRKGHKQKVQQFDENTTLSWRNGEYVYYNQPLASLEGVLKHWYGKTLIFDDPGLADKMLTGVIERDKPFIEFLESLGRTSGIAYDIDNGNIHLKSK